MGHELSQFDIHDRQLLAAKAQSKVGIGKDIGQAKITHTIFGRAKVRIIREQDKKRRAWLLWILAAMVLAAALQGWFARRQTEQVAIPPLSARVHVSAPEFQPEFISSPVPTPSVGSKPKTPSQTGIDNLATSQKSAPQQAPGLKASGQVAVQPVTAQPLPASKTQTAPLATINSALKNQTDMQLPPKLSPPKHPLAPTVATPRANLPAAQPPASSPAAAAPHVEPMIKEGAPALSPAGENQLPVPVNAQP